MLNIEYQEILTIITNWGYPLMLVLMIIEGPIVTLGAAFLASMGFFNIFIVLILSIFGDVFSDIILYFIGYFAKNGILRGENFIPKTDSKIIQIIKESFRKKGAQIIFFTKATTGLCYVTFILAGMVHLNFKKFLLFSVLGGVVWSSFIVSLGYYAGWLAEEIEKYLKFSGWLIFSLALSIILLIIFYKKMSAIKNYKKEYKFIKNKNGYRK